MEHVCCSPQTTVHEALLFSAELRFDKGVTKTVIHAFVEEVMDLVELQTMRDALVIPCFPMLGGCMPCFAQQAP